MLSLGTELFLAFWMASYSVGLPSGSPPPVRAATSMFLISLANILPRRASMTAFLCLVVAHLEWPLMMSSLVPRSGQSYRGASTRWWGRREVGRQRWRAAAQGLGRGAGITAASRALQPRPGDCSKVALHQFDWSRATLLQRPVGLLAVRRCTRSRRWAPRDRSGRDDPAMARGFAAVPRDHLRRTATDGVITARALITSGVPESTVYHRCRDGGPWQRLAPGVILMSTGHPTTSQLVTAALLHGGPDAVLTGLEACRRHGVWRGPSPQPPMHVLVPHDRQVRSAAHIQVERSRRMPPSLTRGGVPLAPVPRAVIDAARRSRDHRVARRSRAARPVHGRPAVHRARRMRTPRQRNTPPCHPRGECRYPLGRRGRRQAAVAGVRPPGAVVERPGVRRERHVPRHRGRLVRRGGTRVGDQLTRLAPQPDRLRARTRANRTLRRRRCARATHSTRPTALRRARGPARVVWCVRPRRCPAASRGAGDQAELTSGDCSRVALRQSDCSMATLLQSPGPLP